jgi:general L-amino acid transport system permease protein
LSTTTTARPSYSPFAAWRDEKARAVLIQVGVLCAVILVIGWLARNAIESISTQQIATGFEFLTHTSGFGIAQTLIDYTEESTYGRALIVGILNTLLVSALGIVLATIIGFLVGVARLSKNWLIAKLAAAYVEMFRNVPLLLWIFFLYYAVLRTLPLPEDSFGIGNVVFLNQRGLYVPHLITHPGAWWAFAAFIVGIVAAIVLRIFLRRRHVHTGKHLSAFWPGIGLIVGLPLLALAAAGFPVTLSFPELHGFNFSGGLLILPELLALTLALALYESTYIAEIVRAGIMGVPRGQVEAARALGLKPRFILRLVVLPQALRIIVPPLTSTYLSLTKNSSLAVAIAYPDLVSVFAGTILNQTGQAVEVLVITMGVYLVLSLATSAFMNWYNHRQALKGFA